MHYYVFSPIFFCMRGKEPKITQKIKWHYSIKTLKEPKKMLENETDFVHELQKKLYTIFYVQSKMFQIVKKETPSWEKVQSRKTCVGTIQMISTMLFSSAYTCGTCVLQCIKLMYIPECLRRKTVVLELFAHLIFSHR